MPPHNYWSFSCIDDDDDDDDDYYYFKGHLLKNSNINSEINSEFFWP